MAFDTLRVVPIFRDLADDDLAHLAILFTSRDVRKGECVLEEGKVVTDFVIVCDGVFHVRRLAGKRQVLMNRLGVGAFFGEINLFDPGVATASIQAMSNARIATIDYGRFCAFMDGNPEAGYRIVSAMMTETSRRLRQTSARLANSLYWSSGEGPAAAR